MVAQQPLVKPAVTSSRAVVVSAHPLASEAGREVLERGGNIVDAAIAVSFALGVVEPDASGIGGDGQAVLFLKGMSEPTVIEFKDQTPRAATLDDAGTCCAAGGWSSDGPMSVNIPGVVAGLDYLLHEVRQRAGELGRARRAGDQIRRGRLRARRDAAVERGRGAAVVSEVHRRRRGSSCPNGRVPRAGDRFVNRDYGATLRTIASDGAAGVLSRLDRAAHRRRHGW